MKVKTLPSLGIALGVFFLGIAFPACVDNTGIDETRCREHFSQDARQMAACLKGEKTLKQFQCETYFLRAEEKEACLQGMQRGDVLASRSDAVTGCKECFLESDLKRCQAFSAASVARWIPFVNQASTLEDRIRRKAGLYTACVGGVIEGVELRKTLPNRDGGLPPGGRPSGEGSSEAH